MSNPVESKLEVEMEPGPEDSEPNNLLLRAGYLFGMAWRLPKGEDRTFLERASRSLIAFARTRRGKKS